MHAIEYRLETISKQYPRQDTAASGGNTYRWTKLPLDTRRWINHVKALVVVQGIGNIPMFDGG